MRQFSVPQFIEVEDKIFGPLSLKQFIYILGGVAAVFIIYVFVGMLGVIFLGLPIAGLAAALAFYKVNNQPFIKVAANAISYYSKGRISFMGTISCDDSGFAMLFYFFLNI